MRKLDSGKTEQEPEEKKSFELTKRNGEQEKEGVATETRSEHPKEEVSSEEDIEKVRTSIAQKFESQGSQPTMSPPEYLQKYLPKHLSSESFVRDLTKGIVEFGQSIKERLGFSRVQGRENVPQTGPFLVVSNHSGGETFPLLGVFGNKSVHIAAGQTLNFERSTFRAWFLRMLGMLSVPESLDQLSEEQKEDLLARVPPRSKAGYRDVLQGEGQQKLVNGRKFVREAVAVLVKGEPVAVFPEGLFTYEGRQLRKAYGGAELLAREYKRVTGKDLPVLPVAIEKRGLKIASPMTLGEGKDIHSVMNEIAQLLPEEERGYYRNFRS